FLKLARELLGRKNLSANIAVVIFIILSSLPLLEGNIANAEIFMILPTILGILYFFQKKTSPKTLLLIGGLFSLSTLFKIPAGFDFGALVFFLIFFKERSSLLKLASQTLILLAGFILPILLTILYYSSQGALKQYLVAAFFQNIPYLSSWQTGQHSGGPGSGVLLRGISLFLLIGFLWIFRKKWTEKFSFVFVWFLFTLFAATLSGRPYPHYLIQIIAPSSLLLLCILSLKSWLKIIPIIFISLLFFATIYFRFWSYPTLSYYQNFLLFASGKEAQEKYFAGFNSEVPQTYHLAQFLSIRTKSEEKIFVWGDSPNLYALSRRLPVGRYTASYHIVDFDGYQETMSALEKNPPRFIIDLQDEGHPFPELKNFIQKNYSFFSQIDKALIYRLII
ncbi:MAG: hypothetical protein Q8P89_01825, partial [bacterium]|nr:hypothetical protein [bacterium]